MCHSRDESGDSQDHTWVSVAHHGDNSGCPFFDRHNARVLSVESQESESGLLLDERGRCTVYSVSGGAIFLSLHVRADH